ncbi:MAG: SUMF1/EgtB/PvdO family nonheme iron enzyme [bacterium]|nr:SUMF1/EgtB/PvdO family nonheme iron enzyme [Candidatus Colisoma equi]
MKNLFAIGLVLVASVAFAEAKIDRVLVRQQWPWSSQVRVDYEVSGAASEGVNLDVQVKAGDKTLDTAAVNAAMVGGDIYGVKNGYGFLAFDPLLAFGSEFATREITVKLTVANTPVPAFLDRVEYRIFDLETGKVEDLTRRDFYSRRGELGSFTTDYASVGSGFQSALGPNETFIWTGVSDNEEYKTKKLVMKRIYSAGKTFYMGPPDDTPISVGAYVQTRFQVQFTKDFYIGVFELTQGQNLLITGTNAAYFAKAGLAHPMEGQNRQTILKGNEGFCKMATARFPGHTLTFPSEAQWEFAAKAGYDGTGLPNGKEATPANFAELEGYSSGRGSTDPNAVDYPHYKVGIGLPNAYGLYNTLGNVSEMPRDEVRKNLLDYYTNTRHLTQPFVDPENTHGSDVGATAYPFKGGDFFSAPSIHPYYRYGYVPHQATNQGGCPGTFGCRVMCSAE